MKTLATPKVTLLSATYDASGCYDCTARIGRAKRRVLVVLPVYMRALGVGMTWQELEEQIRAEAADLL